ncbi:polymorphic toxin-type HINT domain-containing protein [Micromonospora sp. NPDC050397]|uniref:polymorphic toxin-type HINT domain-containing protein n=1 Tax=Micromonospora sp. NPDC050397 TaxID=3364279 RepID=UPI00384BF164
MRRHAVLSRGARIRRVLAAAVTVTMLGSAVAVTPASAANVSAKPTPPPATPVVRSVRGVKPLPTHFAPQAERSKPYAPAHTTWPAARTSSLTLGTPTTAASGAQLRKVGAEGSPVWAQAVADGKGHYSGPPALDVRVLDHTAAQAAGVAGVLLTVAGTGATGATAARTAGAAVQGEATVGIDYSSFAQAYGGNYGLRLRLVALPACATTTPALPACRQATPLPSTNDAASQSVSARVKLTGTAPMVLAAVAAASTDGGKAGTYAATDLMPSGSWTAGTNTGSFTYSYPMTVPTTSSPLIPSVSLNYDSSSVDGQTASTQAQSSWVGDGWSTPKSYIEQSFVSCSDNPGGSASPVSTPDQCYDGPILTLSLNGSSSSLIWDEGKKVWKAESDKGEVITHVTGSNNGTGTYNTDYWRVTLRDGTSYEFGRNQVPGWSSGKPTTNSVDVQPVYSPHSGDPCYNAAGFASSVCTMAYRWNLDYVKDIRGNAMAYYYKQDTNFYGRNKGASNVAYTRDSYLARIDYGFRDGGAYGTVPNQVLFNTDNRCLSGTCAPLSDSTKANWPDVPYDLVCAAGTTCMPWSPSHFSTVRLKSISTQQWSTALSKYVPVDTYVLAHRFPETGDGTSPTLWLDSITRTGSTVKADGSTESITLPSVSFTDTKLENRTSPNDGLPVFYRRRIGAVTTETGSVISVTYSQPNPCGNTSTLDPATNTSSCYPVYWTPDGFADPIKDWFNKWAVTKVTSTDPTGGAAATATSYSYTGGAAWHFDDNELVKAKNRTYGQFRGYAKVQTRNGDGVNDPRTLSEATYYRGMSRNNGGAAVSITDSQGGKHDDADELSGMLLESTSYLGDGGPVDSSTITSYWVSAASATRTRTGLPALTANVVAPVLTYNRQAVTGTGATTWRVTQTDNSYDTATTSTSFGLLQRTYVHTVPADPAYDQCTTNTYAPANVTKNLVGLPAEAETVAVACGGFTQGSPASVPGSVNTLTAPATVSRPSQVVKAVRTYYDDQDWSSTWPQSTVPSTGDATMTRTATDYTAGAYVWQTTSRAGLYDSYGRPTVAYDANGNKTSSSYAVNAVGLTTGVSITNPLNQTSSTTLETTRGLTLTATDPNGVVTTQQYDALGRNKAVWTDSRATSLPANYTFDYQVSKTGVTATTTKTMSEGAFYRTSVAIYDAMLRSRQVQSMTPNGGRMITDSFYDSRGWVTRTYNSWWDSRSLPAVSTPVSAADLHTQVADQTWNTYDGLGRAVVVTAAKDGLAVSSTTTVYNGDRTTVVPPTGGVTKTSVLDPLGRTSHLLEYTTPPTVNIPSNMFTGVFTVTDGTAVDTSYGYDARGNQTTVTDTASNTWTSTYNLLGQVVAKSDPDAGTSSMRYDDNGNLIQSTDGRNKTLSYTYDPLNRKTGSYAATVEAQSTANRVASWVYDNSDNAVPTMKYPIGHLTTSTSYVNGAAYKVQYNDFNVFGKSLSETVTIPATLAGPLLAGSYTYAHKYASMTGLHTKDVLTSHGGLPSETINYATTGLFDVVSAVAGTGSYALNILYDAYGRVTQQVLGNSTNQASVTYIYDPHNGRLTDQLVNRGTATPKDTDKQTYSYDLAGNILRKTSTRLSAATPSETQCYGYDGLARLTSAWTATDNCATTPTTTNHTMVGNNIGSGSAYWTSWQLNPIGNRTQQVEHNLTGSADTTTNYQYSTAQPHALTSTTANPAGTTTYGYDTAGNMTTRNAGQGNQTLTWNEAGKLTAVTGGTAGNSDLVYDADGNLLLEKNPSSTILYLPNEQLELRNGATAVTGTRYYPLPGGGTAIRTGGGANFSFAISDQQGSPSLYLDSTAQIPTWRQQTPYGAPRGAVGTYPDNRGFLNKPVNADIGLVHVGAREYDATIGRFVSVDPVQDLTDPQQWNGYTYANNSPVTMSDPTGLRPECGSGSVYDSCDNAVKAASGSDEAKSFGGWSNNKVGYNHWDRPVQHVRQPGEEAPARKTKAKSDSSWYSHAFNSTMHFAQEHPVLTGIVVGLAVEVGCTLATGGAGAIGCAALAGAAGNATTSALEGGSTGDILVSALEGAAIGAAFAGAGAALGRVGRACSKAHSFDPDTPVLLADGTTKPIKDVQIGDQVTATDPTTGTTTAQPVTALHNNNDTELTDLTIVVAGVATTLHTTTHHPFWDATTSEWTDASKLRTGHLLRAQNGQTATIAEVHNFTSSRQMRDLTVDQFHTYYVVVGETPVLVHNCPIDEAASVASEATVRMRHYTNSKGAAGIVESSVIRASDQNKVFLVPAKGRPMSPRDAEATLGIRTGRGRKVLEFDVPASRVSSRYNSMMGITEWVADGDLFVSNIRVVR